VNFHVYIVFCKQGTKFICDLDAARNLNQHALFNAVPGFCFFIVNEHEPTMSFPQKNNYRRKFCFCAFNLGIGSNANLQMISILGLPPDSVFHLAGNG
jgi:hypothetical protein